MSANAIVGYAAYLPRHRLHRAELAGSSGHGTRVVAGFDEDSTTMAVAAAAALLDDQPREVRPEALYLATTSPAYADKANATAVHAALGLPAEVFAADVAGSARSGMAAWRAAAATRGLAVCADVRTGRPGSADEHGGGDGAAALLFGEPDDAIAEIAATAAETTEVLDRWRSPGELAGAQWEERFGVSAYLPLIKRTTAAVLTDADVERADHVVLVSPNPAVVKQGQRVVTGTRSTTGSPVGHSGAADAVLGLADALDRAEPGETILLVTAADGCDAVLLRTTTRLTTARQRRSVSEQLADEAGTTDVGYLTYLSWRGWLEREPPRRPEPDRPAGPPSARSAEWKFSFTGSRCRGCGFVHLPPARACKRCHTVDDMAFVPLAGAEGTVATYTVDRLAYSPSPPLIDAVVDFDGGGRYTLEVADADPDVLEVGTRVALTFRRLFTAGGVHNYFWKARVIGPREPGTRDAAGTTARVGAEAGGLT